MTEPKPYYGCLDRPKGEVLKPCPFCGNTHLSVYEQYDWKYKWLYFEVHCNNCGARSYSDDTAKQAVENWNRRVKE